MKSEVAFELKEEKLGEREHGMLRLSGEVTFRDAAKLRKILLDRIEESAGAPLIVDLAGVDHMDTAAMAVLVEGLGRSLEDGGNLLLCAPSDSVRHVFELAGLQEALNRCFSCMEELWPRLDEHDRQRFGQRSGADA